MAMNEVLADAFTININLSVFPTKLWLTFYLLWLTEISEYF